MVDSAQMLDPTPCPAFRRNGPLYYQIPTRDILYRFPKLSRREDPKIGRWKKRREDETAQYWSHDIQPEFPEQASPFYRTSITTQ